MTTHFKGLQQNEGKTEIENWNYRAYSKELVAACAQKQRRQKTNKDDRNTYFILYFVIFWCIKYTRIELKAHKMLIKSPLHTRTQKHN
jgi:hypothetical protein